MERKNTVLLTVIAVATLLVAVVGATFAYFTATSTGGNVDNASVEAIAAKLAQIELTSTGSAGSANKVWPGTMNYVGTSVTANIKNKQDLGDDVKAYTVTYTITGKITLTDDEGSGFVTPVKWRLYKLSSSVSVPVTCPDVSKETVDNEVHYSQACEESDDFVNTDDAPEKTKNLVQEGTVSQSGENEIEITGQTIDTDQTVYYYLIVEYPNVAASPQDDDQGKTIKAEINSLTVTSTDEKTV